MIVSIHIPRTGGTSLRQSVLEPVFGDRLLLDYDDAPLSHETAERNAQAQTYELSPELLDRYDCVHGHFLAIKYVSKKVPCQFAVWFRDPLQRVLSRFFYGKRSRSGIVTPEMTIWEFCEIERFHNVYAKYLWGFDIARFDFIGITENYRNSVEAFRRYFGLAGNSKAGIANANPAKSVGESYEIDDRLCDLIRQTNREDFEIYEAARSINLRQIRRFSN